MLDIPSQLLFPWLHGICDDGQKGRDMGAFFGYVSASYKKYMADLYI